MNNLIKSVRLPYVIWKRLIQMKIDGDYESMSDAIECMLDKEGY